ncbi:MAG: glycosyltransferase family 4 protein [Phycisphaerae bacterium]
MTVWKPISVLHVRTVSGTGGGPDKTILKSCEFLTKIGQTAEAFYMLDRRNDAQVLPVAAKKIAVRMYTALETGPVSFSTLQAFRRVLTAGKFDIVHTHDYKSNALTALFRRRGGFKIVATVHGYNRTAFREIFYYSLERWLLKFTDAVISPTHEMYRNLIKKGVSSKQIHVIPNGIDIAANERPVRKKHGGRNVLLYLGRLSKEKDPIHLLRALAILKQRGLDVELILAGAGPERQRLENEIRNLNLNEFVKMPGYISNVLPFLTEADILVNPSRTECMPNTILEAMWSGLPVVATNVGGVGEMIRDGIDGLLCPPKDAKTLADTLERLIADPDLAKRLAESAYQRIINEFSFEKHIEATLKVYNGLLN